MKIPNFFIIGAPKCGTTSLATYLDEHPNIFMCNPKEPHYFSTDIDWQKTKSLKRYLSYFNKAQEHHLAIGEASVFYLYSKEAIPNLLEFNKEAKFIVMVRNPLDMVVSLYGEARFAGDEELGDIEEAWHAQETRRKKFRDPVSPYSPKSLQYESMAKVGEQMERLYQVVERDKVLVVVFDDFIKDPSAKYRRVLDFLDVPFDGKKSFPLINFRKIVKWRWLYILLVSTRTLLNSVGFKTYGTGVMGYILLWNTSAVPPSPLRKEFRQELAQVFKEDVLLLGKLLNRDLSGWLC